MFAFWAFHVGFGGFKGMKLEMKKNPFFRAFCQYTGSVLCDRIIKRGDPMREQIEKKLGCSIDEYYRKRGEMNRQCIMNGCESEIPSMVNLLTPEEMDYIVDYFESKVS